MTAILVRIHGRMESKWSCRETHGNIAGKRAQALTDRDPMPVTTPFVKVEATQAHQAAVVLDGETVAESQMRAEALARERRLTWVHPYDDPRVIAGQGTIALEMLQEVPDLDILVIPIGGGG